MKWLTNLYRKPKPIPSPGLVRVPQKKVQAPLAGGIGRPQWLANQNLFLSDFYNHLRHRIPIISNAIAAWVDLSTSGSLVHLDGGSERTQRRAEDVLSDLDVRCYQFGFEWGNGFNRLMELFFQGLYQNGRFCAEIVPYADISGIAYVSLVDPFSVRIEGNSSGRSRLVQVGEDGEPRRVLPQDRFFYAAYEPDVSNPQGNSILDSIQWVLEIKQKMIEDMARSSHNAGYPRLRVSITPPEQMPGESVSDYVSRINSEFDQTVDQFKNLAVDDNVFTWEHVAVQAIGVTQTDFNWSVNSEKVVEDVVSGLRLYPWVLGLSHGTTKNWVNAQHDLLMQRVQRGARQGAQFMDWIRNTELALKGLPVTTQQSFEPIRDPGRLIQERADNFKYDRIHRMVEAGYISKDEGARQMGLMRAYQQE